MAGPNRSCRLALSLLLLCGGVLASVSAQQTSGSATGVRPCKLQPQETAAGKKPEKHKKGKSAAQQGNAGEACLEVAGSPLEAQERLQAFVREQSWQIGDAEISESSWSFSIDLSDKELVGYTNPDYASQRVTWGRGKAVVLVKTAELGDGFARTTVTTKFEGWGDSDDALAMKRASWTLTSNGRLELELIGALQAHPQGGR